MAYTPKIRCHFKRYKVKTYNFVMKTRVLNKRTNLGKIYFEKI